MCLSSKKKVGWGLFLEVREYPFAPSWMRRQRQEMNCGVLGETFKSQSSPTDIARCSRLRMQLHIITKSGD